MTDERRRDNWRFWASIGLVIVGMICSLLYTSNVITAKIQSGFDHQGLQIVVLQNEVSDTKAAVSDIKATSQQKDAEILVWRESVDHRFDDITRQYERLDWEVQHPAASAPAPQESAQGRKH
jgi:hypothetical protein